MRSTGENTVSWVVVAMAASSLVSMMCLLEVDRTINSQLISSGLQLSSSWLVPYYDTIRFAFILGWFNIVAAIGVHLYSIAFRRRELEQLVTAADEEIRKRQNEQLRRYEEPPILPGLPEKEDLAKTEPEREKDVLIAST